MSHNRICKKIRIGPSVDLVVYFYPIYWGKGWWLAGKGKLYLFIFIFSYEVTCNGFHRLVLHVSLARNAVYLAIWRWRCDDGGSVNKYFPAPQRDDDCSSADPSVCHTCCKSTYNTTYSTEWDGVLLTAVEWIFKIWSNYAADGASASVWQLFGSR